jgi:phosphopantetheinyl transferase
VENYLKLTLNDPLGKLIVSDHGPYWEGQDNLPGLSYSNTDGWGVVVFSRAFSIGVDVEKADRLLKKNYLKIAGRYFHQSDFEVLKNTPVLEGLNVFLDLWMKKEAASKLMRVGLAEIIKDPLPKEYEYQALVKSRVGYKAIVALSSPIKN